MATQLAVSGFVHGPHPSPPNLFNFVVTKGHLAWEDIPNGHDGSFLNAASQGEVCGCGRSMWVWFTRVRGTVWPIRAVRGANGLHHAFELQG
jgi:hypothetical protein